MGWYNFYSLCYVPPTDENVVRIYETQLIPLYPATMWTQWEQSQGNDQATNNCLGTELGMQFSISMQITGKLKGLIGKEGQLQEEQ